MESIKKQFKKLCLSSVAVLKWAAVIAIYEYGYELLAAFLIPVAILATIGVWFMLSE